MSYIISINYERQMKIDSENGRNINLMKISCAKIIKFKDS